MSRNVIFSMFLAICLLFVVYESLLGAQLSEDKARWLESELFSLPASTGPGYWSRLEKISHIRGQLAKLPAVPIKYDATLLNKTDRKVLQKLVEAATYIDKIFLRQVYWRNEEIKRALENSNDRLDKLYLHYFLINYGPFDRIGDFRPFIGTEERPLGANFYPADMIKEEFEKWVKDYPMSKEAFINEYTVIRRQGSGLVAVPYSIEYADLLEPAAKALQEAASLTGNESLKRFLNMRAEAFRTNDYYESDLAWVDVNDSLLEIVIGPYEVYEDKLFNYKAAFESFIVINRPEDAKNCQRYTQYLKDMEANLPIPDKYKDLQKDFTSPIRVVQLVYASGDGRAGVHTSAFVLPNNERVRKERGCKKVMLKNIMEAKFKNSTLPIAKKIVAPDQLSYIGFEPYFRDTVFHELSHALGPGLLTLPDGSTRDVRECLKDNYSSIEECKADVLSIYNQMYLMERGIIPARDFNLMCVSYLAGLFRSIRFGFEEAHGKGSLIQFNWMMERGAFSYDKDDCTYRVNFHNFSKAIRELSRELLEIQATGDYSRSTEFLKRYGAPPEHLLISLKKLYEIPVDIEPLYELE